MKHKKIIFAIILSTALVISNCSKKETTPDAPQPKPAINLSISESKEFMNTQISIMNSEMKQMDNTNGSKAIKGLSGVSGGPNFSYSPAKLEMGESIGLSITQSILSIAKSNISNTNARLDEPLLRYKGQYNFDNVNNKFPSTPNIVSDSLIFVFPDSLNNAINGISNCKLIIKDFETIIVTRNGKSKQDTLPTKVNCYFYYNNVLESTFSMTGSYTSDGIPTNLTSDFYMRPFRIKENFSYNSSNASYNYLLKNEDSNIEIMGMNLSANGNINTEEYNSISGNMFVFGLQLNLNANIAALTKNTTDQEKSINDNVFLYLIRRSDQGNIGRLIYKTVEVPYDTYCYDFNNNSYYPCKQTTKSKDYFIKHSSDGSEEKLKDFVKNFENNFGIPSNWNIKN